MVRTRSKFIAFIKSKIGTYRPEDTILTIEVKPGWKEGTKITFNNEGDEKPNHSAGDIIFVLKEANHARLKRKGNDLGWNFTFFNFFKNFFSVYGRNHPSRGSSWRNRFNTASGREELQSQVQAAERHGSQDPRRWQRNASFEEQSAEGRPVDKVRSDVLRNERRTAPATGGRLSQLELLESCFSSISPKNIS